MKRWLKLPACLTLVLLISLGYWHITTYFSLWEPLSSGCTLQAQPETPASAVHAKAFVLKMGTAGEQRSCLLKGFERAEYHYHYCHDVEPLIHCEGYYGRKGRFSVYSVFRLNDETFSLYDDGSGPKLKRDFVK